MDYTPVIKDIAETMAATFGKPVQADQSYTMVISEKINDYKYKAKYLDYEVTVSSSIPCDVGDYVWVCVPCGDWNSTFVVTKRPLRNQRTGVVPPQK